MIVGQRALHLNITGSNFCGGRGDNKKVFKNLYLEK